MARARKTENTTEPETGSFEKTEQLLDTESLSDEEMMRVFVSAGAKILISEMNTPTLYIKEQVNAVIDRLAGYKQTSRGAVIISLQEFFRQGGANASISPLKKV